MCASRVYARMLPYLHTLGTCTYNAVLAWLVKKAEDNQVELPFFLLSEAWSSSSRENEGGKTS